MDIKNREEKITVLDDLRVCRTRDDKKYTFVLMSSLKESWTTIVRWTRLSILSISSHVFVGLPQKTSYQWREYSWIINPRSFLKLIDNNHFLVNHMNMVQWFKSVNKNPTGDIKCPTPTISLPCRRLRHDSLVLCRGLFSNMFLCSSDVDKTVFF